MKRNADYAEFVTAALNYFHVALPRIPASCQSFDMAQDSMKKLPSGSFHGKSMLYEVAQG
jgi:hypothetical protein